MCRMLPHTFPQCLVLDQYAERRTEYSDSLSRFWPQKTPVNVTSTLALNPKAHLVFTPLLSCCALQSKVLSSLQMKRTHSPAMTNGGEVEGLCPRSGSQVPHDLTVSPSLRNRFQLCQDKATAHSGDTKTLQLTCHRAVGAAQHAPYGKVVRPLVSTFYSGIFNSYRVH